MSNRSYVKSKSFYTGAVSAALIISLTGCLPDVGSQQPQDRNGTDDGSLSSSETATFSYADGIYEADGVYQSPGGREEIGVTLTLEDGIIVDADVETRASLPISRQLQQDFADNYRDMVVGRSIDGLELGKVSGSSLTPLGFNDALDKIRSEAQT